MAYATDFLDIFKKTIDTIDDTSSPLGKDSDIFFQDWLLDPDFNRLDDLNTNEAAFNMYRELNALPKAYR